MGNQSFSFFALETAPCLSYFLGKCWVLHWPSHTKPTSHYTCLLPPAACSPFLLHLVALSRGSQEPRPSSSLSILPSTKELCSAWWVGQLLGYRSGRSWDPWLLGGSAINTPSLGPAWLTLLPSVSAVLVHRPDHPHPSVLCQCPVSTL